MPIIELCNANEPGATKYEGNTNHDIYYRKVHVGNCIKEREANYYDDSDFYMTVWDDEFNKPIEIQFATTRGWCYPCFGSSVDAVPEVMAKYKAWEAEQVKRQQYEIRKSRVLKKRANRKIMGSIAAKWGVPYKSLLKLEKIGLEERIIPLFNLKIRSEFKKSMRQQVINWLMEDQPKYKTPLSPKQLHYLEG